MKFRKYHFLIFLLGTCFFVACSTNQELGEEKSVEEIMAAPAIRNSDIVRSPVSANEPLDTNNVAQLSFTEETYEFGEVLEGEIVEHTFAFTNTGTQPLLISNARSTCGCTVPEWPKTPIAPGEGGEITVRFNTENKKADQVKPITITANTYPATSKIYLKGRVKAKEINQ